MLHVPDCNLLREESFDGMIQAILGTEKLKKVISLSI